jgi:hypothetical protein
MKVRDVGKVQMINLGKQPILDASRGSRSAAPEWTSNLPRWLIRVGLLAPIAVLAVFPRPVLCVVLLFRTGHYAVGVLLALPAVVYVTAVARDIMRGRLSRVALGLFLGVLAVLAAVCVWFRAAPLFLWNAF